MTVEEAKIQYPFADFPEGTEIVFVWLKGLMCYIGDVYFDENFGCIVCKNCINIPQVSKLSDEKVLHHVLTHPEKSDIMSNEL